MFRSFIKFAIILCFTGSALASGNEDQCRSAASVLFNNCMAGVVVGPDTACTPQTRCEDLCLGGKRVCRVFDCKGVISSQYNENCREQPRVYSCTECRAMKSGSDSYQLVEKQCYSVYDVTDGARTLLTEFCTDLINRYDAQSECQNKKSNDLRCDR
jgi:hypothetical protein